MTDVDKKDIAATMRSHKICVLVPTYNNAGTVGSVVSDILEYSTDVIVVNDGSTDGTSAILRGFGDAITVVEYANNRGKGYALKAGFKRAIELGYEYAITIDSDGQHYASDIKGFVAAIVENQGALIVGERNLTNVDINGKSSFANKFSNFWFAVQTGRNLKDTQTGYRAYPLKNIYGLNLLTCRYEAELELLVFAAWNGVRIKSIPIKVYYPPQSERVSHFRPAKDFTRISILNTILCVGAIVYGLPVRIYKSIANKTLFNSEFKPFTRKNGEKKAAATTIRRLLRSTFGILVFLFLAIVVFKPVTYLYRHVGKESDAKKLRFHRLLQRISMFFNRIYPGSGTNYENPYGETFSNPALIICNHQSHLDLPVIMGISPRLILLTNDWVWNNRYFGNIVHYADFLPVSAGMDVIVPRLRELRDKGYSIVVFPEGTRSDDCTVQRFHQGAFLLAQELQLDIVPMVIHGAGYYLAKSDFMFRRGKITLRILERVPYQADNDMLLRKQASMYRKLITDEHNKMSKVIETPEYLKSLVLYKYAYRGWSTVAACKRTLHQLPTLTPALNSIDTTKGAVHFINAGIGVIPLLVALMHKEVEVYGYEEDITKYNISIETSALPANLHLRHTVWSAELAEIPADSVVYMIQYSPLSIKLNS